MRKKLSLVFSLSFMAMMLGALSSCGHEHNYKEVAAKAATCEADGNKAYFTCDGCDKVFDESKNETTLENLKVAAKGHTAVRTQAKNATCTTDGNKDYWKCSTCNEYFADSALTTKTTKEAVTIKAKGHTEAVDTKVDPTCTDTGLTEGKHCSVCNEVLVAQEEIAAKGHTEAVDAKVEPTCTDTGLTEGKHCSVCNEVLVAQEEIVATGHTEAVDAKVEPTCTDTGLTEGKHCSVCNEVLVAQEEIAAKGHAYGDVTYEWSADNSTCTATRTCATDSTHVETETVTAVITITTSPTDENLGEAKPIATFTNAAFEAQTSTVTYAVPMLRLNTDKDAYIAYGAQESTATHFYIPKEYNDLPVTIIGAKAFRKTAVKSLVIPASITYIDQAAFYGSAIESITFEANSQLKVIDESAFDSTKLKSIVIPASVTQILDFAFYECESLESVTFEKDSKLETIGYGAFLDDPITSIVIPKSVKTIGEEVFSGCKKLTEVTFEAGINLAIIPYTLFADCTALKAITIPASVKTIEFNAFYNCTALESLTFEANSAMESIEGYILQDDKLLKTITFNGTKEEWFAISKDTYWDIESKVEVVKCTDGDFNLVPSTDKLTITGTGNSCSVKALSKDISGDIILPKYQFDSLGAINGYVVEIEGGAFSQCENITSIRIHRGITKIGEGAFNSLKNITIYYEGTLEDWEAINKVGYWAFASKFTVYCIDGSRSYDV